MRPMPEVCWLAETALAAAQPAPRTTAPAPRGPGGCAYHHLHVIHGVIRLVRSLASAFASMDTSCGCCRLCSSPKNMLAWPRSDAFIPLPRPDRCRHGVAHGRNDAVGLFRLLVSARSGGLAGAAALLGRRWRSAAKLAIATLLMVLRCRCRFALGGLSQLLLGLLWRKVVEGVVSAAGGAGQAELRCERPHFRLQLWCFLGGDAGCSCFAPLPLVCRHVCCSHNMHQEFLTGPMQRCYSETSTPQPAIGLPQLLQSRLMRCTARNCGRSALQAKYKPAVSSGSGCSGTRCFLLLSQS